ncbi:MAG: PEP-CTERM sorting domain-containing protein [Akkermansiaceae bacterium]
MSNRLSDGTVQQAAMTPSLSKGERREMTALDAAFFVDIGYTTVPEPTSLWLMSSFSVMLLLRRNK